uniref:Chloride channel protein n=1 Tax=Glossina austeni TaxID=7395 RepID=A0A1A9VXA4_GLOAU
MKTAVLRDTYNAPTMVKIKKKDEGGEQKSCKKGNPTSPPARRHSLSEQIEKGNNSNTVPACKETIAARALRTTNKITFASMERDLIESTESARKLAIANKQICTEKNILKTGPSPSTAVNTSSKPFLDTVKEGTIQNAASADIAKKDKPKNKMRFNDIPIYHSIEPKNGAIRKVVDKDFLPRTTHRDRFEMLSSQFRITDHTDKIITDILIWSNDWLIKRSAAAAAQIKEGPMIHAGAVVAAGISQGKGTTFAKDFHVFKYFRDDHEKRNFVLGEAAAGVAAAFGAPIGGMFFSLEEAASFWNQNLIWRTLVASIISSFTLNIVLSAYHGLNNYTFIGFFNLGKFEQPLSFNYLCFWNMLNTRLSRFRERFIKPKFGKLLKAAFVAMLGASMACAMIYFINDCRPLSNDPTEYQTQLFCEDNEYNAVAASWLQTLEATVRSLFHDPPALTKS